jgi:hypothetical protein
MQVHFDYETVKQMRFAVELKGRTATLANVAPCFQGNLVRVEKIGDTWFLRSSEFEKCKDTNEVFKVADRLLTLINRVSMLHMHLIAPFELGYVQAFNDSGNPTSRGLQASYSINVYSHAGCEELKKVTKGESFGSEIVSTAFTKPAVQAALSLVGDTETQWPQIYDIIEYLGGADVVAKKHWASRQTVRVCRQTANHYRHLGSPKNNPLPPNPPTIGQARTLVFDLLKKWMASIS